jgi:aspartate kinase
MLKRNIIVQKYGGTSVGDISKIKGVAQRIKLKRNEGYSLVVVVSAMGKTTDQLISLAKELTSEPDKRELDMLLSTGEQISIALLSMALNDIGIPAVSLTGSQVGILTLGSYTKAKIKEIDTKRIFKEIDMGKVVIIAGFQGVNGNNDITTLGRGGSDTSAVALAAKLNCPCEIYTDVDGIYSSDPRILPSARKLSYIGYEEILEMSSLGAKVMHSRSIEIAQKFNVPVWVLSAHKKEEGTLICNDKDIEGSVVTGLVVNQNDVMLTFKEITDEIRSITDLLTRLAKREINIDMISQTAPSKGIINLSLTIPKDELDSALKEFEDIYKGGGIEIMEGVSKISVVGIGMRSQSGVAASFFSALAKENIKVKMVTTSEIRISCVIDKVHEEKAIKGLAEVFNLSQ